MSDIIEGSVRKAMYQEALMSFLKHLDGDLPLDINMEDWDKNKLTVKVLADLFCVKEQDIIRDMNKPLRLI